MEYYPWLQNQREAPPDTPQLGPGIDNRLNTSALTALAMPALAAVSNVGAQVGLRRNLEFTAGERAHRISMGSYTKA